MVTTLSAYALMKQAFEGGYRFPDDFPGFTCAIVATDQSGTSTGTLIVSPDYSVALELKGNAETAEWVEKETRSMVNHRSAASFDERDGQYQLELAESDPYSEVLGNLIIVKDDRFNSSYRVRDGHIAQVNREMGETRFSIQIQSHRTTADGLSLPHHFSVHFWNSTDNRLQRSEVYEDTYTATGGMHLPAGRTVRIFTDTGMSVRHLTLSGHRIGTGGGAE